MDDNAYIIRFGSWFATQALGLVSLRNLTLECISGCSVYYVVSRTRITYAVASSRHTECWIHAVV